jgi:putative flippase GtrA
MRLFSPSWSLAFEGFRFALTGLSSYLLYALLFYILSRRIGIGEYASLVAAYMSAAVLYFVASKYFTFTSRDRYNISVEILRFILLLCLTALVNWASFYCASEGFHLDFFIALFIGIVISSALSFTVMRTWAFASR